MKLINRYIFYLVKKVNFRYVKSLFNRIVILRMSYFDTTKNNMTIPNLYRDKK
jgi:hypothetical protein